ncbi:transferrin-binding protein-like solute binding protein [Qipengyuania sp. RANM35]|uniref:transferrin-binding protein-like solute binding protein n=1 Tax=Qipengyuania sp. RANM35 TaxID=3068635 RepID=UPI0034DB1BC8
MRSGTYASNDAHYPPSGWYGVSISKDLEYTYSNLAIVFENGWGYPVGGFAYGLATQSGDVPVTGTATYRAQVYGGDGEPSDYSQWDIRAWNYYVEGTADLTFDFGAGTLAGAMDPTIFSYNGETRSLGRYEFVNTVFGVGSTQFSGELANASLTDLGTFNGLFTGPQAAELIAQWRAPYVNPWTNESGLLRGVWIGKKGN